MKRYTFHLLMLSTLLSVASIMTISKGYGEIYPFYTWMLFTKPYGMNKSEQTYRLYGVKGLDTIRILNNSSKLFDGNEKYGIVNRYGKAISINENSLSNKKQLYEFAKLTDPNYEKYLLVLENYDLQKADHQKVIYQMKIITELKKQ